jgi:hypothetical protein
LRLKVKSPFEEKPVGIEWAKWKTDHTDKVDWSEVCRHPCGRPKEPCLEISATTSYQSKLASKASTSVPATSPVRNLLNSSPCSPVTSCSINFAFPDEFDYGSFHFDDDVDDEDAAQPSPPRVQVKVALPFALPAAIMPNAGSYEDDGGSEKGDDASMLFLGTPRSTRTSDNPVEQNVVNESRMPNPMKSALPDKERQAAWNSTSSFTISSAKVAAATVSKKTVTGRKQRSMSMVAKQKKASVHDSDQQSQAPPVERLQAKRALTTRVRSRAEYRMKTPELDKQKAQAWGQRNNRSIDGSSSRGKDDDCKAPLPSIDMARTSFQSPSTASRGTVEASDASLLLSERSTSSSGHTDRESEEGNSSSQGGVPELAPTREEPPASTELFSVQHPLDEYSEKDVPSVRRKHNGEDMARLSSAGATARLNGCSAERAKAASQSVDPSSKVLLTSKSTRSMKNVPAFTVSAESTKALVQSQTSPVLDVPVPQHAPKKEVVPTNESMVNIVAFFGPSAAASGYATAIQMLEKQPLLASTISKSGTAMAGWLPLHLAIMLYRGPAPTDLKPRAAVSTKTGKRLQLQEVPMQPIVPAPLVEALLRAYPFAAGVRFRPSASADLQLPLFVALSRRWDLNTIKVLIDAFPGAVTELQALDAKEALRDEPRLKRRTWAKKIALSAGCDAEVVALLPRPRKVSRVTKVPGEYSGGVSWHF